MEFKCDECNKSYKSYQSRWNHVNRYHNKSVISQNKPLDKSNNKPIISYNNIIVNNNIKMPNSEIQYDVTQDIDTNILNIKNEIQMCKNIIDNNIIDNNKIINISGINNRYQIKKLIKQKKEQISSQENRLIYF